MKVQESLERYAKYRFDLWPVLEKWSREKYGKKGRLGFLYARDVREWLELNGYDGKMSSLELSAYQPLWNTLRGYIIAAHGEICEVCGKDVSGTYKGIEGDWSMAEVDHIQPIALGGLEFDVNNLRVTCKECNTRNRPNTVLRMKFDAKQEVLR